MENAFVILDLPDLHVMKEFIRMAKYKYHLLLGKKKLFAFLDGVECFVISKNAN